MVKRLSHGRNWQRIYETERRRNEQKRRELIRKWSHNGKGHIHKD